MIWALVREQLRAQRRFVIATGVVLALALTAASYGLFMSTTTSAGSDKVDAVFGYDKESHLISIVTGPDATNRSAAHAGDAGATLEAQDAALTQAVADGSDVVAVRNFNALGDDRDIPLVAMGGTVDWAAILASGKAPAAGEAAIGGDIAQREGLHAGDTWNLPAQRCDSKGCTDVHLSFVISGIARSGFNTAGLAIDMPSAYVSWDDSARVATALAPIDNAYAAPPYTLFSWTVGSTALDKLGSPESYSMAGGLNSRNVTGVAFAVLGALFVGLIAMAFAVGRAQAQSRSKWVATARTLGASKRQIGATNLLESGVVGLVAGAIGVALGYALASLHVWVVQHTVPVAAYPTHVIAPAWVIPALLLLALVLSSIVGAVPAFWAARVPPVAALKPVSDISEAEVSRRVSARPLVIAWAVANLIAVITIATRAQGLIVIGALIAGIVILVTTPMLMHEVLRLAIPWAGSRLSRSPRRTRMMAGDALLARPRQATIPAFIVALGVGVVVAVVVPAGAANSLAYWAGYAPSVGWFDTHSLPSWAVPMAIAATVITTVVTLAIGAVTATLTSREAATREALGATRADSRWAGAIGYLVSQASGIALGLAVGLYAGAWVLRYNSPDQDAINWIAALSAALLPVLGYAVIAAIGAAIGAALTASFTPQTMTIARLEAVA